MGRDSRRPDVWTEQSGAGSSTVSSVPAEGSTGRGAEVGGGWHLLQVRHSPQIKFWLQVMWMGGQMKESLVHCEAVKPEKY